MPVFDLFKRLVGTNAPPSERRGDERVRASLGARVLVVDDSATIRAVLGKMLAQDGYETLKAADGESAVEMAQSQLPDLIFLDIVLPGMSGFAVLRALRRDGRTRTTPIIMMSGNQQATEQFYVQRFGADGFVKKPFGRSDVFHAIRSLVQAGRMPARVEATPVEAIPDGMTQEEWNAIPDVGMPDEAHMAQPTTKPVVESAPDAPVAASVPVTTRADAPVHAWSVPAASGAMRPSIGGRILGATDGAPAPLVVHIHKPRPESAAEKVPDKAAHPGEAAPSPEPKG
jgi:twitching motility two-component system response regulator PilH